VVSVPSQAVLNRIQLLYPWMSTSLMDAYSTEWEASESEQLALAAVRTTTEYQQQFRGNYDPESGEVRMSEADYMASRSAFNATIESFDLNPAYFEDDFIVALENEVSPTELIGRMEAAYERIVQSSDDVRRYYSENYGIEMTDSAILASAINPSIGEQILNRQIAISEIGGSASTRGFDIGVDFATMIEDTIGSGQGADRFFGEARNLIPLMQTLLARHSDPNDSFDLEDVAANLLFDDPETRRMIRRTRAQEASTFTGGAGLEYRRGAAGVSGLAIQ
jgi:hypothetical protein